MVKSINVMAQLLLSLAFSASLFVPVGTAFAQGMGSGTMGNDDHTAREEAEGKEIWEKFQAKQVTCASLSADDFGVLGEYFMGAMMGDSHAAMNQMMTSALGEEGEEQMHVVMGKRLTGCDPAAAYPAGGSGFIPMMNMWGIGRDNGGTGWWGMHGYSGAWGWFWVALSVLWWVFVITLFAVAIKWLFDPRHGWRRQTSALEILMERYAKGEVTKQEFEEKKKDLG